MPITNDLEFFQTFVGPCHHLGSRVVIVEGRAMYQCMMRVTTRRGITYRCNASRPLTAKEIFERKSKGL